jgi:hypothetical protein
MGSGSKFTFGFMRGLVFGFYTDDFPFTFTLRLYIGPLWVTLGFGKGYDE